nr:hypothetical protein [Chromobacterium amazonense]MDQ4540120.1 hypothetical protein [Chromobacterium amazonense]
MSITLLILGFPVESPPAAGWKENDALAGAGRCANSNDNHFYLLSKAGIPTDLRIAPRKAGQTAA